MLISRKITRFLKIFIALFIFVSFLLFISYISNRKGTFFFQIKQQFNEELQLFNNETIIHIPKGYLIYNSRCKIQDFDPFDFNILEMIEFDGRDSNFPCQGLPPLVETFNTTYLKVNQTSLQKYYGRDLNYCLYTPIFRDGDGHSDDEIKFGINEQFVDIILVKHEFVRVQCFSTKKLIYTNFYPFILKKPNVEKRCNNILLQKQDTRKQERFNVNIIGIDSVSRLNFIRFCPETYDFLLNDMKAFELKGFNKVADNTFVNLVPLLIGKYLEELSWTSNLPFDNYPFIWKNYSAAGYRTLFAEDDALISAFNYIKKGFFYPPTDYYLRPFYMAFESSDMDKPDSSCLGTKLHTNVVLDWIHQFSKTFSSDPYFSFAFISSLTHNTLESAAIGDQYYKTFLKSLMDEQLLNNTILFIFSDHGMRYGSFRETYIGRLEERLPLAFIVVPPHFYQQYPDIIKTLKRNTMLLTSPFDIYETLKDILYFSGEQKTNISSNEWGISLFNDIPEDRNCESIRILPHWCTCQEKIQRSPDEYIVRYSAKYVVTEINQIIRNVGDVCEELTLNEINDVWATVANEHILKYEQSLGDGAIAKAYFGNRTSSMTDFTIMFSTIPGMAKFEATVRHDEQLGIFHMVGEISRVNKYNNQSWCVQDHILKLYCYCKTTLNKK